MNNSRSDTVTATRADFPYYIVKYRTIAKKKISESNIEIPSL
jgi:hypothetical protein